MGSSTQLTQALNLAEEIHRAQNDKLEIPYIYHVLDVAERVNHHPEVDVEVASHDQLAGELEPGVPSADEDTGLVLDRRRGPHSSPRAHRLWTDSNAKDRWLQEHAQAPRRALGRRRLRSYTYQTTPTSVTPLPNLHDSRDTSPP